MKTQKVELKYVDKDELWTKYPELIIKVSFINKNFGELNDFVEKYNISGITNGEIFIYENLKNEPDPDIDYLKNRLESLGFIERRDFFSTQFYNKPKWDKIERRAGIYNLSYKYDWLICKENETGISVRFLTPQEEIDPLEYFNLSNNKIPEDFTFSNYKLTDLEYPNELPDIDRWQITIVMREEYIDGMNCYVLSHEGRIIWKESGGGWEFYGRFLEIADILQEKYGENLMDFVPDVNFLSIYGDSISGVFQVHNCRMKIREKHRLVRKASREDIYEIALQELVEEERKKNPESFLNRWMNRLEESSHNLEESEEKKINEMLKKLANDELQNKP